MKRLRKIYGLIQTIKSDERGFVLLELVIGLPLILILLWSLNNMFVNTWQKCRNAVADFILQQEMESAMQRIVDDARFACYFKDHGDNRYEFYHYQLNDVSRFRFNVINSANPDNRNKIKNLPGISDMDKAEISISPVKKYGPSSDMKSTLASAIYIKSASKIYRQTTSLAASSPITGDSLFAETIVTKFICELKHDKLIKITLEAKNIVTDKKFTLKTEVYMQGWRNDE